MEDIILSILQVTTETDCPKYGAVIAVRLKVVQYFIYIRSKICVVISPSASVAKFEDGIHRILKLPVLAYTCER